MLNTTMTRIILVGLVGLGSGAIILIVREVLPDEPEHLQKAEEIDETLPGVDCGACGSPSCFGYSQKLAKNPEEFNENPCVNIMNDDKGLDELEQVLSININTEGNNKVSIIHCIGESEIKNNYKGVETCKAASQISGGYKECPYGCLGFGDCVEVCPENAISINSEKDIAVVDEDKCTGCGLCEEACPQNIIEIVPISQNQYLGCSYEEKKDIKGREKCDKGCLHCRLCLNTTPDAIEWDEERDLPEFTKNDKSAAEAVEKCPTSVIVDRS